MHAFLKRLLKWDQLSESEQNALYERFDMVRYRSFYFASFVISLLPLSIRTVFALTMSDKERRGGHSYGRFYGRAIGKFKYRPVKLLEIGIGGYERSVGGQSINSWQCYFPFGRIVAADIKERQKLQNFKTRIYQLDQGSEDDLNRLVQEEQQFDIIIDDGSHLNRHQLLTFKHLFQAVKRGGVYIVEDVQTSFWPDGWDGAAFDTPEFDATCVGYFLELSKYLNHAEFRSASDRANPELLALAKQITAIEFSHNLIVIHKGPNTDPSNAP